MSLLVPLPYLAWHSSHEERFYLYKGKIGSVYVICQHVMAQTTTTPTSRHEQRLGLERHLLSG